MNPKQMAARREDLRAGTRRRRAGRPGAAAASALPFALPFALLFALPAREVPAQAPRGDGAPVVQGQTDQGGQEPAPDPRLAAVRRDYAAAEWPRGPLRAGFALGGFEVAGLRGGAPDCLPPAPVARRYADEAGTPRVLVELYVAADAAAAHGHLLGWLATRSAPEPAPAAREHGLALGDAAFAGVSGAGPGRLAWVAWARGNLAVRVLGLDPGAPPPGAGLAAFSQALDGAMALTPVLAADAAPPAPVVRLRAATDRCRAGESVHLDLEIEEPGAGPDAAGPPIVNWVLGGPGQGQGYVEPDPDGGYRLRATGPGPLQVEAVVVGRLGRAAAARVDLRVD